MAQKTLNRDDIERVIREGGSVSFRGRLITTLEEIPDITEFTRTMSRGEAQALLAERMRQDAENQRIIAALQSVANAGNEPTAAPSTANAEGGATENSEANVSTDGEGSPTNEGSETGGETGETDPELTGNVSATGTQSTGRGRRQA
jgi:hypothetical protein